MLEGISVFEEMLAFYKQPCEHATTEDLRGLTSNSAADLRDNTLFPRCYTAYLLDNTQFFRKYPETLLVNSLVSGDYPAVLMVNPKDLGCYPAKVMDNTPIPALSSSAINAKRSIHKACS